MILLINNLIVKKIKSIEYTKILLILLNNYKYNINYFYEVLLLIIK